MTFKLIALLGFIFGLNCALAQTPSAAEKLQFRTFGWEVSPTDLYYEHQGKDVKLMVTHSARSPFYAFEKRNELALYKLVPGPEGKMVRKVVAVANLTSAGPWPLIVLRKSGESGDALKAVALADDPKSFPFNTCRFINLTETDLYAKYGEEKLKIPAKGIEAADMKAKSTSEPEVRNTMLVALTGDGPVVIYSNNWVVSHDKRVLVIITHSASGLRVSRISDSADQYAQPQNQASR